VEVCSLPSAVLVLFVCLLLITYRPEPGVGLVVEVVV